MVIVWLVFLNDFHYLVDVTPVWKLSSMIIVLKAWFHLQGYIHLCGISINRALVRSVYVHNQTPSPFKQKCRSYLLNLSFKARYSSSNVRGKKDVSLLASMYLINIMMYPHARRQWLCAILVSVVVSFVTGVPWSHLSNPVNGAFVLWEL